MNDSLNVRIENLESEIRRWKAVVVIMIIAGAPMLITAAASAQGDKSKIDLTYPANRLEAHDFTLVGRDDKPYGRLYIKESEPVLELYDREGKVIWSAPPHGGFTPVESRQAFLCS